jgi:predicted nucleotidyltransferase
MLGLRPSDTAEILQILASSPHVERAIVFGSRAKGTQKRGSDVDIALSGKSLTSSDVHQVSDALNFETRTPYFFDVLDIAAITNQALAEHIRRVGVVIYQRSKQEV